MGRRLPDDQTYHQTATENDIIPYQWVALEILTEEQGKRKYTHKSDVWSFGVTMWEIFTYCEKEPYEDIDDQKQMVRFLKNGKRLPNKFFPFGLYDIMLSCWNEDPQKRPSFFQLYSQLKEKLNQSLKGFFKNFLQLI